jgi:hypothetical protein
MTVGMVTRLQTRKAEFDSQRGGDYLYPRHGAQTSCILSCLMNFSVKIFLPLSSSTHLIWKLICETKNYVGSVIIRHILGL